MNKFVFMIPALLLPHAASANQWVLSNCADFKSIPAVVKVNNHEVKANAIAQHINQLVGAASRSQGEAKARACVEAVNKYNEYQTEGRAAVEQIRVALPHVAKLEGAAANGRAGPCANELMEDQGIFRQNVSDLAAKINPACEGTGAQVSAPGQGRPEPR